jgi:SdrD B-like domain
MKRSYALVALGLAGILLGGGMAVADSASQDAELGATITTSTTTVGPGGSYSYKMLYKCSNAPCKNGVIYVGLPVGVTIASSPNIGGATVSNTGSGLQITFTGTLSAGNTNEVAIQVSVPTCLPQQPDYALGGAATVSFQSSTAAEAGSSSSSVTIADIPQCDNPGGGCSGPCPTSYTQTHRKRGRDVPAGGLTTWSIEPSIRREDFYVDDEIPDGLVVHEVSATTSGLEVRCRGEWIRLSYRLSLDTPAQCLDGAEGGRYPAVTAVRLYVKAETWPQMTIETYVPDDANPKSTIENCAVATTWTTERFCYKITILAIEAVPYGDIRIVASPEWPLSRYYSPWYLVNETVHAARYMGPRDVAWSAVLINGVPTALDLVNPVFAISLSPQHEFVQTGSKPNWQVSLASPDRPIAAEVGDPTSQPGCLKPEFTTRVVGGRDTLIWSFKDCIMRKGLYYNATLQVFFTTRLKPGVVANEFAAVNGKVGFAEKPDKTQVSGQFCSKPLEPDTNDLDGDGLKNDQLCDIGTALYKMPEHSGLTASNAVLGSLDEQPTFYPAFGSSDADGGATYTVEMKNTGTLPLAEVDLVAVLPYFNDKAVSATESSDWDMKLDVAHPKGAVEPMRRLDLDGISNAGAGDYTLAYSAKRNPCRFTGVGDNGLVLAGAPFNTSGPVVDSVARPTCDQDSWNATADQAQSLGIRYRPADPMLPSEVVQITIHVKRESSAPQLPTGVAWSNIAFTAETTAGSRLLTVKPRVGGVRIVDAAPSFTGVVWNDENKDGYRDDIESAIGGVQVDVVDTDGTGKDVVVGTATTAKNGSYFITGLLPDKAYRIRFSGASLDNLAPTLLRAPIEGVIDTARDSDVDPASSPFEIKDAKTKRRFVSAGFDGGFVPAPESRPGMT